MPRVCLNKICPQPAIDSFSCMVYIGLPTDLMEAAHASTGVRPRDLWLGSKYSISNLTVRDRPYAHNRDGVCSSLWLSTSPNSRRGQLSAVAARPSVVIVPSVRHTLYIQLRQLRPIARPMTENATVRQSFKHSFTVAWTTVTALCSALLTTCCSDSMQSVMITSGRFPISCTDYTARRRIKIKQL